MDCCRNLPCVCMGNKYGVQLRFPAAKRSGEPEQGQSWVTRAMDIPTRFGNISDAQKLWRGGQGSVAQGCAGKGGYCDVRRKLLFFVSANQLLGHQIKLIDGRSRANTWWVLYGRRKENGGTGCQISLENFQK